MQLMKIGDLVKCYSGIFSQLNPVSYSATGVIVGFNKKGEGGKDFVHVLVGGKIVIFLSFDIRVVNEER